MLRILTILTILIPCLGYGQICSDGIHAPKSGDEVFIAFDLNGTRYYLDGVASGPKLVMRTNLEGRLGASWKVSYNPDKGTFNFDSGSRRKFLDGKTRSGGLTLRDNTSLAGTHWIATHIGNGKFTLRANSGGEYIWLSFDGNKVTLSKKRNSTTDAWRLVKKKDKRLVFKKGEDGYNCYRIPSLITLSNGEILAICEGRKNGCSDSGDIDVVMKKSSDNGDTWAPLSVIWNNGVNTCGNPTVLQDSQNKIWLLLTHNLGGDDQTEISSRNSEGVRTIWFTTSADNGKNWTKPKNISIFTQIPSESGWDATGPGTGLVKRDGTLIFPANGRDIYSVDNGKTWCISKPLPRGSSESQIVELESGDIMRNARPTGSFKGYRTVIKTTEGYPNYANEMGVDQALPGPVCQGSIFRYNFSDAPSKGRILFGNPNHAPGERRNYTVRLSYDDGKTWKYSRQIWEHGSGYSCLSKDACGYICVLLEESNTSDVRGNYGSIYFYSFSLDYLTEGNDFMK